MLCLRSTRSWPYLRPIWGIFPLVSAAWTSSFDSRLDSRKLGLGQRLDTNASSSNADWRASICFVALQVCFDCFEQGGGRWPNPRSQEPSSPLFCSQPLACDGQIHPMKADLKRWWGCNRSFEHCIAHWHTSAVAVLVWSRLQKQQTRCEEIILRALYAKISRSMTKVWRPANKNAELRSPISILEEERIPSKSREVTDHLELQVSRNWD